jgi:hypothetical protein
MQNENGWDFKKISKKSKRSPESHATDAIALASLVQTIENISLYPFYVWRRYQNRRRQLHKLEPERTGKRRREGGNNSIYPFKKNDVVIYDGKLARTGGFMDKRISLHNYDIDNKRFMQSASPEDCHRLFNQKIMFEVEYGNRNVNTVVTIPRNQIPPALKPGGLPLTP